MSFPLPEQSLGGIRLNESPAVRGRAFSLVIR
jgi:hypothetical protein